MRASAREHQEDLGHTGEQVIDSDLCLTVEKTNKRLEESMTAKTRRNLPINATVILLRL